VNHSSLGLPGAGAAANPAQATEKTAQLAIMVRVGKYSDSAGIVITARVATVSDLTG
jgi:hypothetical protein